MVSVRSVSSATVSPENPLLAAQQLRAPRAHGAGHHRNAIQQIESALFQILAGDVFERLPAREPAIAVHHFHVAGDGAHLGVGEMAHEARNRFGIHDGIGINGNNNFAGGFREAVVQRRGLAVIGLADQAHARIAREICAHQFGGAVRGAVIHHQNFEIRDNRKRAPRCTVLTMAASSLYAGISTVTLRLVFRMIGGRGPKFLDERQQAR